MIDKPHSAACERNREPILGVLRAHFADRQRVLEIGSGTGQHAAHFAASLPDLHWQTSDREEHLPGIRAWLAEAGLSNAPEPRILDVLRGPWPSARYDAIFSANTLHIMSWPEVEAMFAALPAVTTADAKLAIYGPFNYGGKYTSPSNAEFDAMLTARSAALSGIRDFARVDALAQSVGFRLLDDVEMPANNRLLIWQRRR